MEPPTRQFGITLHWSGIASRRSEPGRGGDWLAGLLECGFACFVASPLCRQCRFALSDFLLFTPNAFPGTILPPASERHDVDSEAMAGGVAKSAGAGTSRLSRISKER